MQNGILKRQQAILLTIDVAFAVVLPRQRVIQATTCESYLIPPIFQMLILSVTSMAAEVSFQILQATTISIYLLSQVFNRLGDHT